MCVCVCVCVCVCEGGREGGSVCVLSRNPAISGYKECKYYNFTDSSYGLADRVREGEKEGMCVWDGGRDEVRVCV